MDQHARDQLLYVLFRHLFSLLRQQRLFADDQTITNSK